MPLEIVGSHVGEMDSEQLWETTLDPKTRNLEKVTIEDCDGLDELFDTLMGSNVDPRRKFIIENSDFAKIDI